MRVSGLFHLHVRGRFPVEEEFDVGSFFFGFIMDPIDVENHICLWIVVLVRIMEFNPQTNRVQFQTDVGSRFK